MNRDVKVLAKPVSMLKRMMETEFDWKFINLYIFVELSRL